MFWTRLIELCNEKGTTPTAVVKSLHIAGGSVTKWKSGTIPRGTTLLKLSEYFGVSADYLLGNSSNKNTSTSEDDDLTEYLEELKNRPEMKMLFSLAKGATKEDVERAVAIIEALRKSENG